MNIVTGGEILANSEITFRVTLSLDETWANNQTEDEVVGYIRDRLNTSLGFRGEIKRLRVIKK
jgi:hypothetical protein